MKQRLKWYAPLQRWLTEAEHRAHVEVERELAHVYASIVAESVPLDLVEAKAAPADQISYTINYQDLLYNDFGNLQAKAAYQQMAGMAQQNALQAQTAAGLAPLGGLFGTLFGR